jgi:hypothetical protein
MDEECSGESRRTLVVVEGGSERGGLGKAKPGEDQRREDEQHHVGVESPVGHRRCIRGLHLLDTPCHFSLFV